MRGAVLALLLLLLAGCAQLETAVPDDLEFEDRKSVV